MISNSLFLRQCTFPPPCQEPRPPQKSTVSTLWWFHLGVSDFTMVRGGQAFRRNHTWNSEFRLVICGPTLFGDARLGSECSAHAAMWSGGALNSIQQLFFLLLLAWLWLLAL